MTDYLWGETVSAAARVAKRHKMDVRWLLAIGEIESRNDPGPRGQPIIRCERHWFKKYVTVTQYTKANSARLMSNGSQTKRWVSLTQLAKIDQQAAYLSHSWGTMQVMGFNWEDLGYSSVIEMVETARSGPEGQYELGAQFLKVHNLYQLLETGRLEDFATRYNGPKWKQNDYVNKLKTAWAKHLKTAVPANFEKPPKVKAKEPVGWIALLVAGLVAAFLFLKDWILGG